MQFPLILNKRYIQFHHVFPWDQGSYDLKSLTTERAIILFDGFYNIL